MEYFETSALLGTNIDRVFDTLVERIFEENDGPSRL